MDFNEFLTLIVGTGAKVNASGNKIYTCGNLDLRNLIRIHEGVTLEAGGFLHLNRLPSIPEGVTLKAGGYIILPVLASVHQTYAGKNIELHHVDGYTMQKLSSSRTVDGCEVYRAAYFNGCGDGKKCYIAKKGNLSAHGKSVGFAIRDVQFKEMQEHLNVDELADEIRREGVITFNQYRLLTGACESGLLEGIKSLGLPEDTQELPIDQVVKLSNGHYGGEIIADLFG